ncbi:MULTISPECIES: hypothetical protein [unclassified Streptomyces]|uniref:hypothetical protein n=1 Tax=unclassified Streptomyces TaxID=2593676 RepID=UPI000DC76A3C|nr:MULTISPECIES: hypothetical protein [unclassified Streptomyces]AWZ06863.1 hypothetical protein DRB89_22110 [Streptomyces sp. ICC4]AWZ14558.1 hypothetical protein DRB96_22420 [Streptomyces sp. ICC1]
MDTEQYEVRTAGTAVFTDSSSGHWSRMPALCRECDARTGLTFTARGADAWITCPESHVTRDWRLSPEAVRDVASVVATSGDTVVPATAEIWLKVRSNQEILSDCEDIA